MNIQNLHPKCSSIGFKGLEAKKLDAILVNQNNDFFCDDIINQLSAIASQYKVQVQKVKYYTGAWLQDDLYFTPNKKIFSSNYNYASFYAYVYDTEIKSLKDKKYTCTDKHIDGGNIFFVTDKDGQNVILSAKNNFGECDAKDYIEEYGVDKVIVLPHADYHADLFVTPIGDNKILVANDNLMSEGLNEILSACTNYINENPDDEEIDEILRVKENLENLILSFSECKENYFYKNCEEETAKILEDNGFEVIKVPSRLYNFSKWHSPKNKENITHLLNYSNSITFKDKNSDTVLIAAKSGLEDKLGLTPSIRNKIGTDFEKIFIKSVAEYIKPKNIYFIKGNKNHPISEILENYKGGLHCMCTEVPCCDKEINLHG